MSWVTHSQINIHYINYHLYSLSNSRDTIHILNHYNIITINITKYTYSHLSIHIHFHILNNSLYYISRNSHITLNIFTLYILHTIYTLLIHIKILTCCLIYSHIYMYTQDIPYNILTVYVYIYIRLTPINTLFKPNSNLYIYIYITNSLIIFAYLNYLKITVYFQILIFTTI